MKTFVIRLLLAVWVTALGANSSALASDPVGDFFKRLGNSIKNAGQQPSSKRTSRSGSKRAGEKQSASANGANENGSAPSPSPSPTAAVLIRVATAAPPAREKKRDLPYAIPVPDKPGFVTSPFAPGAGWVDVHGFRAGTEVKDPFTGRTFLTP